MKNKIITLLLPFVGVACLAGSPNYNNFDTDPEGGGGGVNEGGADGTGGASLKSSTCDCSGVLNAKASCINDECFIDECLYGFEDCNGDHSDGCEVQISADPKACGSCTNTCNVPGTNSVCLAGQCSCELAGDTCACTEAETADCDQYRTNGCETFTMSDDNHCGSCGHQCKNDSYCSEGQCECSGLPEYNQGHGINSCLSCLNDSCCLQLQNCLGNPECSSIWNSLVSCKQTSPNGCAFSPDSTNSYWINLRSCRMQENCQACGY